MLPITLIQGGDFDALSDSSMINSETNTEGEPDTG